MVDAKVSLAAYLDAAESRDPDVIEARMRAHARHLREHVKGLAAKEYWRSFEPTPEFVVLFVPGDAFLAPALERDPQLLDDAMAAKVLIATPTTLIAMLRTVAYSWQQEALTANAREVFELGRELYRRLGDARRPRRQAGPVARAARSRTTTRWSARWSATCWSRPAGWPSCRSPTPTWPRPTPVDAGRAPARRARAGGPTDPGEEAQRLRSLP